MPVSNQGLEIYISRKMRGTAVSTFLVILKILLWKELVLKYTESPRAYVAAPRFTCKIHFVIHLYIPSNTGSEKPAIISLK
jgi:hypothetical protein